MFNLGKVFNTTTTVTESSKNISNNFFGDSGKAVLSAIDDGVLAIDSKGNIRAINDSAEQLTGWTGEDAIGLVFNSILKITNNDGAEMVDVSNPISRVLNTGENFSTRDLFLKTQSGKTIPIFLAVNSIDDQKSGVVVVFRDISKDLKENREQAEFISTASHEMRTPVASIEGYLGLALNPTTATIDDRARSYLEKAHENTQHLGQLFQDLLDITKAEDGRLKNEPVVLDALAFSREIWEGLRVKAEEKGLDYIFEPDQHKTGELTLSPVFFIHADRDHLHEVLDNLFENAIKYTPSGKVSVNVSGDNNTVKISVTDSGIGIPAEDIPHLFQKFYRVDNTETREINGTGLGLFLSRKLTESIGGSLNVESEYKKGSTFTVHLPRISRDTAENLKLKEEAEKAKITQEIQNKQNQREIDEADRDILNILNEKPVEIPQQIQIAQNNTIPPTTQQQINTTPQFALNATTVTQQIASQQAINNPIQQINSIPQSVQQNSYNQQSTQVQYQAQNIQQQIQPTTQYTINTQQQSVIPQQQIQQANAYQQNNQSVNLTNYQPQSTTTQQSIPQPQNIQQSATQAPQYDQKNYQQFAPPPPPIPVQQPSQLPPNPTISDIEQMRAEYIRKMMAQRQS